MLIIVTLVATLVAIHREEEDNMSMQKSYCKQMRYSGPESLAPSDATKFDVLIQMEVLAGCNHGCLGCFVDKNIDPAMNQMIIDRAKELTDGIKRTGLNLREFVIGPTDFFTATNTESVLNNSVVQEIMREHTGARIAAPAKFDLATMDKVKEIFAVLDDEDKYRREMIIEFIMPIGRVEQMLNDDEYFNSVMEKVEFFKNNTPKQMDWSWTLQASNVVGKKIDKETYNKIVQKSVHEYGTIVEMNPAFARAPNQIIQRKNLFGWNDFLGRVIDKDNSQETVMSMANLYCNSINFVGLTIVPGENGPTTHLNVMLHEQAFFLGNKNLDVTGLTFEEILERKNELVTKGINKSSKVSDCADCKFAVACASRLIFEAQESLNIDGCVMNKDVLDQYNPTDWTWNDDAMEKLGAIS
tara:strand:- start:420 stop:1658 length:1239 start_codon:yes stop_codon:yes gene_type:complete